jgi:hypothetical protein
LEQPLDWLCQGDIFVGVPVLVPRILSDATVVAVSVELGPALLVTHDCALDKTRSGLPTINRLNFLPLLSFNLLDPNRKGLLKRRRIEPFEALYVGQIDEFGEAYCVLSEMYPLPAEYFEPVIRGFVDPSGNDQQYLVATENDTRVGRLESSDLALLRDKLNAYWTRRIPDEDNSD